MIRNTVETTVLEATPLLSGAYFWHVALYGVLPAIVVFVAPLAATALANRALRALRHRGRRNRAVGGDVVRQLRRRRRSSAERTTT